MDDCSVAVDLKPAYVCTTPKTQTYPAAAPDDQQPRRRVLLQPTQRRRV
jgi:hypothetical protein